MFQNYRARKCSIVQEEEDEDDMTAGQCREELTPPHGSLNRRGSRSEGKLNLALQERLAESERRKDTGSVSNAVNHKKVQPTLPGSNATCVARGTDFSRQPDGMWASPIKKNATHSNSVDNTRPRSAVESTSKLSAAYIPGSTKWRVVSKQHIPSTKLSIPKSQTSNTNVVLSSVTSSLTTTSKITTSKITESSTISIPIHSSPIAPNTTHVPKYKTLPSPTRPLNSILGPPALNEIFEEADGVVGDLARPTSRGYVNRQGYEQRRSKFHKTRTASCSSSDASDDDSESRKKRAHKITGEGKPLHQQRRDSHDDSSDSQDPGGSGGAGGSGGGGGTCQTTSDCNKSKSNNHAESNRTSSGGSNSGGNGGRRQCRRRPGETRLRESQSLNRITEVQEAELTLALSSHQLPESIVVVPPARIRGFGARLFQGWSLAAGSNSSNLKKSHIQINSADVHDKKGVKIGCIKVDKVTVKVQDYDEMSSATGEGGNISFNSSCKKVDAGITSSKMNCSAEEKENFCKLSSSKFSMSEKQKNNGSKKGRLLSRYFQVHKKLCLPLPGLFGRGRLYKAQSCGSIIRERVNPPSAASLLLCGEDRWCPITGNVQNNEGIVKAKNPSTGNGINKNISFQTAGDINPNLGLSK